MDCSQNISKTVICNVRSVSNFLMEAMRPRADIALAPLLRPKYPFRHDAIVKSTAFVFLGPSAAEKHGRVCYYLHVLIERRRIAGGGDDASVKRKETIEAKLTFTLVFKNPHFTPRCRASAAH